MSKKFPGLTSEKIPQNAPQWISVCQKFPGSYLSKYLKVHQNGCQFKKKVREWLVKMAQNAPKWISVFQKFHGSYLSKYLKVHENGCQFKKKSGSGLWKWLKMHQNGYPFFKNFPGMKSENTSKCTKMDVNVKRNSRADVWKNTSKCTTMDIRLSKISRELLVKIPQSASKWMSI
mgnify:CR=1 FL=1